MGKVKIKLNRAGVRDLLKDPGITSECVTIANGRAPDGYDVEERRYPERIGAAIVASTPEAYYSNLKHNTLEKVIR